MAKVGRMMGQFSHVSNGLTLDALRFITNWFVFYKHLFLINNLEGYYVNS